MSTRRKKLTRCLSKTPIIDYLSPLRIGPHFTTHVPDEVALNIYKTLTIDTLVKMFKNPHDLNTFQGLSKDAVKEHTDWISKEYNIDTDRVLQLYDVDLKKLHEELAGTLLSTWTTSGWKFLSSLPDFMLQDMGKCRPIDWDENNFKSLMSQLSHLSPVAREHTLHPEESTTEQLVTPLDIEMTDQRDSDNSCFYDIWDYLMYNKHNKTNTMFSAPGFLVLQCDDKHLPGQYKYSLGKYNLYLTHKGIEKVVIESEEYTRGERPKYTIHLKGPCVVHKNQSLLTVYGGEQSVFEDGVNLNVTEYVYESFKDLGEGQTPRFVTRVEHHDSFLQVRSALATAAQKSIWENQIRRIRPWPNVGFDTTVATGFMVQ